MTNRLLDLKGREKKFCNVIFDSLFILNVSLIELIILQILDFSMREWEKERESEREGDIERDREKKRER